MSFGADTDYWGFADTNVKLQSSTQEKSRSSAQAVDSDGDVAAETQFDTITSRSCTYRAATDTAFVLRDTATAVDFRLGKVISNYVITSIEVATDATNRPTITISGESCPSADSLVTKYDPSDLEVPGARKADPIGATMGANTLCTGSSASATVQVSRVQDSDGISVALDVYGGRVEATNEFVGSSAAGSATVDTGFTASAGPSLNYENTAYSTGSVTVFKNLAGA